MPIRETRVKDVKALKTPVLLDLEDSQTRQLNFCASGLCHKSEPPVIACAHFPLRYVKDYIHKKRGNHCTGKRTGDYKQKSSQVEYVPDFSKTFVCGKNNQHVKLVELKYNYA